MANDQTLTNHPRFLLFNWHFVAKIALILAAVSCLGAVLVLHFITGSLGENYAEVARYFSLSRKNIGPTILAAGLILVSFASIITWLIALYTSFYIAGPLFRFSRNFEILIEQGPAMLTPTRKSDSLKLEEQQIRRSVAKLQQHYGEMRALAEDALSRLDSQPASSIEQLKEIDRAAHL